MIRKYIIGVVALLATLVLPALAIDHKGITSDQLDKNSFTLMQNGKPTPILMDVTDERGISIAVENLAEDFRRVGGTRAEVLATPRVSRFVLIGSLQSRYIRQLIKDQKLDVSILKGKSEQLLLLSIGLSLMLMKFWL